MVAALLAAWACIALADPNQDQSGSRPPLGNNPHPVIWGGQQSKPAAAASQPSTAKPTDNGNHDRPQQGVGHAYSYVGGYAPYIGGSYSYDPYGGYQYPYYPSLYGSYLPPAYLPAEEVYGPRAAQRFIGMDNQSPPKPNANAIQDDEAPSQREAWNGGRIPGRRTGLEAHRVRRCPVRQTGILGCQPELSRCLASAPQLAEAWFRQGFAMIAIGRYDLAVAAIRRPG